MKKVLLLVFTIVIFQSCSKSESQPNDINLNDIILNQVDLVLKPSETFQLSASFNPDNAKGDGELILGTKIIPLGKDDNQYYACKFMFEHEPHQNYSWDEIYEAMEGIDNPEPKKWKTIHNAVYGINIKVKRTLNTDDELFTYENRGVIRNY